MIWMDRNRNVSHSLKIRDDESTVLSIFCCLPAARNWITVRNYCDYEADHCVSSQVKQSVFQLRRIFVSTLNDYYRMKANRLLSNTFRMNRQHRQRLLYIHYKSRKSSTRNQQIQMYINGGIHNISLAYIYDAFGFFVAAFIMRISMETTYTSHVGHILFNVLFTVTGNETNHKALPIRVQLARQFLGIVHAMHLNPYLLICQAHLAVSEKKH